MTENIKRWKNMLDIYKKYLATRNDQLEKGINNYSLINSLLRANDEVRLHSRFIYSMLMLKDLPIEKTFLELFLDQLPQSITNKMYELDSSGEIKHIENINVLKEEGNIDLLIHDEKHFIIIENKLDAKDGVHQISRYISKVKTKYNIQDSEMSERVSVVYLSKNKTEPFLSNKPEEKKNYSLIGFALNSEKSKIVWDGTEKELNDNQKLEMTQGTILEFFHLKYFNSNHGSKLSIESWVEVCLSCIEEKKKVNMSNVVYAFKEYGLIVDKLNRNKIEGKLMSLSKYVLENKDDEKDLYKFMSDSQLALPIYISEKICIKTLEFFKKFQFEEVSDNHEGYEFKSFNQKSIKKWLLQDGESKSWKNVGVIFKSKKGHNYAMCLATRYVYVAKLSQFNTDGSVIDYGDSDVKKFNKIDIKKEDLLEKHELFDFIDRLEYLFDSFK